MADPTRPFEPEEIASGAEPEVDPAEELERLRELLLGKEQRDLRELGERFDTWQLTPEEVAERLPEAIGLRTSQDGSLGRALAPTIEEGISESVDRNPQRIAQAIYPILGPAIRKAISDTVAGFVETLNRAIEHSFSLRGLKWRFEALRTGVPYAQIVLKHALVYQVEQVYLIHAESGLLLCHATLDESKSRDADLVSGMLTAIRDFVADSFDAADEGGLRTFKVGSLSVLVETGPRAILAAIVRGQPPAELWERLQEALETVHLQLRPQLAEFEGDTEVFEPAEPILHELLETVVATDQPQSRGVAPKIAWAIAGLVVLVLVVLGVRNRLTWGDAREALRQEPGLTLIESDRGWRRWRFDGLRDPLARDPLDVLRAAGVDVEKVEGDWEPYMSFDPEMVGARAERLLDPPNGVQLVLEDGVIRAGGSASARWVLVARGRARGLIGVSELDLSRLDVTVPNDLAESRTEIERQRVLFALASASIGPEALEQLDALTPRIADLMAEAGGLGYDVVVRLMGRTDSLGSEETNQTLSQRRVEAVLDALAERGLVVDAVETAAIGMSDPIAASDEEEQARLNRSVSFEVKLSGWEDGEGEGS